MARTAITINFPQLSSTVDYWRMKTVEVARNGVPPHVTVLFPWIQNSVSDRDIEAVARLCIGTLPFEVEFNAVKYFNNGTVYLSLADDQEILSLSRKIWAGFPDTPPYGGLHENPIPHLTVAQGHKLSIEDLYADVTSELGHSLPQSCCVHEVSVLEESEAGIWHTRATVALT